MKTAIINWWWPVSKRPSTWRSCLFHFTFYQSKTKFQQLGCLWTRRVLRDGGDVTSGLSHSINWDSWNKFPIKLNNWLARHLILGSQQPVNYSAPRRETLALAADLNWPGCYTRQSNNSITLLSCLVNQVSLPKASIISPLDPDWQYWDNGSVGLVTALYFDGLSLRTTSN